MEREYPKNFYVEKAGILQPEHSLTKMVLQKWNCCQEYITVVSRVISAF